MMQTSAGVDLEQPAEEVDPVRWRLAVASAEHWLLPIAISVLAAVEDAIEKALRPLVSGGIRRQLRVFHCLDKVGRASLTWAAILGLPRRRLPFARCRLRDRQRDH
jgi:hypothetical protein